MNQENVTDKKEKLLMAISGAMIFRQQKAEEYPDDPRNMRTANDLIKLLEYVQKLPDTHPVFEKYNSLDDERIAELDGAFSKYFSTDRADDEEHFINSVILRSGEDE